MKRPSRGRTRSHQVSQERKPISEYRVIQNVTPLTEEASEYNGAAADKVVKDVTIDPQNVLTPEQRARVEVVLRRHHRAFAEANATPAKAHAFKVRLPLKPGVTPHRHQPPRLSLESRKWVQEHTAELLKAGVIRRSNSPFASRIVLVRKRSGGHRVSKIGKGS